MYMVTNDINPLLDLNNSGRYTTTLGVMLWRHIFFDMTSKDPVDYQLFRQEWYEQQHPHVYEIQASNQNNEEFVEEDYELPDLD